MLIQTVFNVFLIFNFFSDARFHSNIFMRKIKSFSLNPVLFNSDESRQRSKSQFKFISTSPLGLYYGAIFWRAFLQDEMQKVLELNKTAIRYNKWIKNKFQKLIGWFESTGDIEIVVEKTWQLEKFRKWLNNWSNFHKSYCLNGFVEKIQRRFIISICISKKLISFF